MYHPLQIFFFLVVLFYLLRFPVWVSRLLIPFHHTERHTTVCRTPLDEGSTRRRGLYLKTTHNTHKRETSMLPLGFEPTILASERPKTHALDRTATGIPFKIKTYNSPTVYWCVFTSVNILTHLQHKHHVINFKIRLRRVADVSRLLRRVLVVFS
jgi:hypothetical protein